MLKRFGLIVGLIVGIVLSGWAWAETLEFQTDPATLNLTIAPGQLDTANIWAINLSNSDMKVLVESDPWISVTPKEFEVPKKAKRQVLALFMIPNGEASKREGKITFRVSGQEELSEVKVVISEPQLSAPVPDEKDLKIVGLMQNLKAREKKITELEKTLKEISIASSETVNELKEKVQKQTVKSEEAEKKLQEATASWAAMEEKLSAEIKRLKGERDEKDRIIFTLSMEIAEIKGKITPLQVKAGGLNSLYASLANGLAEEIKKGEIDLSLNSDLTISVFNLFPSGGVFPAKKGSELLTKLGNLLKEKLGPDFKIEVRGFTDTLQVGINLMKKYPTNWELSIERAASVFRILKWRIGIDRRFSIAGYGPSEMANNRTSEGRARNRRVEIVISEGK